MKKANLKPGDPLPKQRPRQPTDRWTELSFPDVNDGEIYKCPKPGVLAVCALGEFNTPPP
jgi:hypothetical protein